ncbi:MAG: NADPH-dependent ferric siderophore reductase [Frankiales bacterium]|nr:NADPH-dependent ferric siderophore reductase [Frankiales bacterium]
MNHLDAIAQARAGTRARKVGYPRRLRTLEVLRIAPVGAGLLRLTLGGPGLAGFESHTVDEHVKLLFPDQLTGELRLPEQRGDDLSWPNPRPLSRDYSVRRFDGRELDVDVVSHPGGLASDWAAGAQVGDPVHLVGPLGGLIVPDRYPRYLLAGDLSAAPVIARWLETLPGTATGWAVVEVGAEAEQFDLTGPPGMDVHWAVRNDPEPGLGDALEREIRALPVHPGDFVWIAGEAGQIRPLRRWARDELGLPRSAASVVGYWKRGAAGFEADE